MRLVRNTGYEAVRVRGIQEEGNRSEDTEAARAARDLVMVGKKDPTGGPHGSVSRGGWVNVRATELWVPCDSQTSSMHAEGLAAWARLSAWC